jgi:hypothetical protein
MAEFKLGRIRFVWKGDWTVAKTYYQDDVVSYGGKIYICVIGHNSQSDFFTDLDIVPTKWNLVSEGQTWKGDWAPNTSYVYSDIVKYGARLYIANTIHTSEANVVDGANGKLETDQSNWDVFAEGLDWKGAWATEATYKINDIVKYGGTTYVCNTPHTSAATVALGLENDQSKWDYFNQGIEYKTEWAKNVRYKVNDVVKFGASLWISTQEHTSAQTNETTFAQDSAYWSKFVDGFQFEGEWEYNVAYQPGDIVQYGGNQYISKLDHTNKRPTSTFEDEGTTNWDLFSEGFKFLDDWGADSSNFEYKVGQIVRQGGYTYICTADHQDQQPPNADYWKRLNSGLAWKGTWIDDIEYVLGDVVRYGSNSYVCVLGHFSEGDDYSTVQTDPAGGGNQDSRPDLDLSGTYWNIIAVGSETSVLNTTGDLVYYSGAGPARLPIGLNGQVLTVNEQKLPEWAFIGSSADVYYVAEHGVDEAAPIYGKTIDRPWRSIRYAAQQVELGANNPYSAKMIDLNRRFIQREIINWIEYQIDNATNGDIFYQFSYESAKCERDMGLIVDAAIWDITHGGNVRSRESAISYVTETTGSPYLEQKAETVAAINYGLTIIESVLNNQAPAVNYQTTNGDNSTAIVAQYTDATLGLQVEPGIFTEVSSLVKIVTDAITAGVITNIPARNIRTTLIKVSTGQYYEVLPIIVPAECCVMGDELRSTKVQPRTSTNSTLTPRSDVKYSFSALERMEEIVGDIIEGTAVSATTGNTVAQDQTWPLVQVDYIAPQVKKLARIIRREIDFKVGDKIEATLAPAYSLTDPNYGESRDLFLSNKEFIQAEIIAYIGDQYPNILYSRTKCKQDVGYIIDAVAYDLTYGGNWQSVNAGKSYFNGNTGTLQIDGSEKTATIAAYGYIKSLLQTVGRGITVTPTYQSDIVQTGGEGGTLAVSNVIGGLVDDIITTIQDGFANAPTVVYPTITNSDAQTASTAVEAIEDAVKEQTIDFISANFGSFKYNSAKCRRDLGLILTNTAFDIALGTNYNAVFNGLAYQRANNAYNMANQRVETVGAIRQARDLSRVALAASATSVTRSDTAFNEIVDIIQNGVVSTDTAANALVFPVPTAKPTTASDKAVANLVSNRDFMKADVIGYIADNYSSLTYNSTKCARDVGYIVDALCYDVQYGGNTAGRRIAQSYFNDAGTIQISGQESETVAAYGHLSTIAQAIVQETNVTPQTSNTTEIQSQLGDPAGASEATAVSNAMTIITNVLTAGNLTGLPAESVPSVTWAATEFQTAKTTLDTQKPQIILDTIQYITNTYSDFKYDHAKCSRDVGLILEAAKYDYSLGTNFASIVAAYSYLRAPSKNVLNDQKTASIAAFEFARTKFYAEVPVGSTYDFVRTGINDTWEWVDDTILGGNAEGGNKQVGFNEIYDAILKLEQNKEFIVQEVTAYVNEKYKDTATATATADNSITISDTSWLHIGFPVKFTGTAIGGVNTNDVYYVRQVLSATKFTIATTLGGAEAIIGDATGTMGVTKSYTYVTATCERDVREYINAIRWDLTWPQQWERTYTNSISFNRPAVYKTKLAARYYVNSVIGSQEEDFYYMRNGTGLRMQTLDGLRGDLTPPNEFGTSRGTAGAYASLDPGWGPDDTRVWITARSPYLQNNTCFGYAATGQRIDGALHNGGNDSMVSNDFTQVISDGIGAHILNNGRAELVSVFTYYSHIGYLAESGGRIRATNGNNSYGKFGSVAEGVDPDETAVTAIVDNRTQYNASIATVTTDNTALQVVEYAHAGNDYTEVQFDIFGAGDSEELVGDEFRDDAVYRVRVDEIDDSSGKAGGSGFLIVGNTAQSGTTTSINLAATDGNISSAYPGMRIQITGGAAIGQFAIIDTYNAGTKLAEVVRDSDGVAGWDHILPGTAIVSPNGSSTYQIEPRIEFTAPPKTVSSSAGNSQGTTTTAWKDATYVETSDEYAGIASTTESDGSGATFDVIRNGEKYYVEVNNGGTGYDRLDVVTLAGTNLGGDTLHDITVTITTVDANGAVVDFDFTGYGLKGRFLVVNDTTSQGASGSTDGITWTSVTIPGDNYTGIASGLLSDGSSTYKESSVVVINTGGSGVAYSEDTVTWSQTSLPGAFNSSGENDIAFGNVYGSDAYRYVVIGDADTDTVYSDDGGQNWTIAGSALPGTGFDMVVYGKGLWVAGASGTTNIAYSTNGTSWTLVSAPTQLLAGSSLAWGSGRFIAVSSSGLMYSLDGITWTDSPALPAPTGGGTFTVENIAYGQGMFVATTNVDSNELLYSQDGITWQIYAAFQYGASGAQSKPIIAFGNPNRQGIFAMFGESGVADTAHWVRVGATTKGRASVANEQIFEIRITEPGSGYDVVPTITVTDPNNINDVILEGRLGKGVLGQPTFVNRGQNFTAASGDINQNASNGNADFFQNGNFVAVRRLTARPVNGSNIEFASLPGQFFKLVNTVSFIGSNEGSFTGFLQISPEMSIADAPVDGDPVELRIRFSQVRLTGHDFLDIGTGNFADTNYPGVPVNDPAQANETVDADGGRVFFTATDQDGNFRVGDLFSVEQATGVATLNAEAFNIAGLQELSLGEVTLGGNSASVSEFSTDPFFTANSDTVVPTQRAVKAYIEAQIGGGGATLVVNSVTAGDVYIGTNQITTLTGSAINIDANVVFTGTLLGTPLAYNYFLR